MKHIAAIMRQALLEQLDKIVQEYKNGKIDKSSFENLVNLILDKINEIDKADKK